MSRSTIQCKACGATLAERHHGGRIDLVLDALTTGALVSDGAVLTCQCEETRFLHRHRDESIDTASARYGNPGRHPRKPVTLNTQVVVASGDITPEGYHCHRPATPPAAESGSGDAPDTTP